MKALYFRLKIFLRENQYWFNLTIGWFLITILLGLVLSFFYPSLIQMIVGQFSDKFGANPALNSSFALQIFEQNLAVAAIALFGGIVVGIAPFVIVGVNGYILGYVVGFILFSKQANLFASLLLVILGLVPHGIIEIPMFFLASALGFKLGLQWLRKEYRGMRWKTLGKNLSWSFLYFLFITIGLFIAAFIEVFVSGKLVGKI